MDTIIIIFVSIADSDCKTGKTGMIAIILHSTV